jgi:hypothetical protein
VALTVPRAFLARIRGRTAVACGFSTTPVGGRADATGLDGGDNRAMSAFLAAASPGAQAFTMAALALLMIIAGVGKRALEWRPRDRTRRGRRLRGWGRR